MAEIKPCPFCGNEPQVEIWYSYDRAWPEPNEYENVTVRCNCGIVKDIEEWNWREQTID